MTPGLNDPLLELGFTAADLVELQDELLSRDGLIVWDTYLPVPDAVKARPHVNVWRYDRVTDPWAPVNVSVDVHTPPGFLPFWPVLLPDVFPSRPEAREALGVGSEHLTLVVPSQAVPGTIEGAMGAIRERVIVWESWPVYPVLAAADLVVGAPGLNLYSEVAHLWLAARWIPVNPEQDIRSKLIAPPFPRVNRAPALAAFLRSLDR